MSSSSLPTPLSTFAIWKAATRLALRAIAGLLVFALVFGLVVAGCVFGVTSLLELAGADKVFWLLAALLLTPIVCSIYVMTSSAYLLNLHCKQAMPLGAAVRAGFAYASDGWTAFIIMIFVSIAVDAAMFSLGANRYTFALTAALSTYASARLLFTFTHIIASGCGSTEAMSTSFSLTRGHYGAIMFAMSPFLACLALAWLAPLNVQALGPNEAAAALTVMLMSFWASAVITVMYCHIALPASNETNGTAADGAQ